MDLDDLADLAAGHAELVYDFRDGGAADGWLHALFRYEDRASGHAAESSFGAHMFNTLMTYRDEPQSYNGPPPGLTTRLFLKLGDARAAQLRRADLPCLGAVPPNLVDHAAAARRRRRADRRGACRHRLLRLGNDLAATRSSAPRPLEQAGPHGYVLVRDPTCRLFGYHGLMDDRGGFSLDHMFGF